MAEVNATAATTATANPNQNAAPSNETRYRALVIDSGPIIKLTGVSSLRDRADVFYTVPAVLGEIRDARARQHLETLPFDIETRDPSPASITAVTEFARLTGDYQSLSRVDLIVLALVYELEKEGCGVDHIRTTPKRTVGVGKVQLLNAKKTEAVAAAAAVAATVAATKTGEEEEEDVEYDEVEDSDEEGGDEASIEKDKEKLSFFEEAPIQPPVMAATEPVPMKAAGPPKSWAILVNASKAGATVPATATDKGIPTKAFYKMNLKNAPDDGQFSDAEGDEDVAATKVEEEPEQDFPSLSAAIHVPYEAEVDEMEPVEYDPPSNDNNDHDHDNETQKTKEMIEEDRKVEAVKPISNSGKLYNSFRGYNKLFKPSPVKKSPVSSEGSTIKMNIVTDEEENDYNQTQSRIMGGNNMSGQDVDVEDDGEGWITSTKDIRSLQATGGLAPTKNPLDAVAKQGPPLCQRTACATTDFAMQNVILQMNLELLSVDGVKIRRLKNWVTRCGACFKVYTKNDDAGPHGMKRLFCERCGSDMLQRIAASVDGKTGRLRLHMSKKHKTSTRGTKFSLPKPGGGNRFQGDLLLREDQLMMGAWNQKAKIRSGGKAKSSAQSMFGQDIAENVGCRAKSVNVDDISAGFGRRNPNSAKGRERRGKKKKTSEKACGLRRYH